MQAGPAIHPGESTRPAATRGCCGPSHFILASSVEEGHVPHGPGLPLGVHDDPVPAIEHDGGVVGVPDPATDVDAGVAPHGAPAPALRLRAAGQDALVLRLSDSAGVAGA